MDDIERKRGYVGIDESNHGRFPEIYVAVHSTYRSDGNIAQGLNKKRKGNIPTILKKRDFRYILFSEEYGKLISDRNRFLIASCEFINFFNNNYPEEDITFIIDGEYQFSKIMGIEELLKNRERPEIILASKADVTYPITNKADNVARILFRKYQTVNSIMEYFPNNILTPKLEDYLPLMKIVEEKIKTIYHNRRNFLGKR